MDKADVRVYGKEKERREYIVVEYLTSDRELRYVMVGEVIGSSSEGKDAKEKM